jgi:ribonucleoside-diphosphate reductase alpha chain
MSVRKLQKTTFMPLARSLLADRYQRKDKNGKVIETPDQLWRRVARCAAAAEQQYGNRKTTQYWEERFYEIVSELLFLPNSPTLFNAGRDPQMLSACFVLPVPDSLEGILQVTKEAGLIQKSGGGVGFDFSAVRPKGAVVRSTAGVASGPVSFMKGINAWAQVIKQGGLRRAANMAVLPVHHPDIEEFIRCKIGNTELDAFNLSVGITDEFMAAYFRGETYRVIDPQTGNELERRNAKKIWQVICESAVRCGDPGLVFLDTVNEANPTPHVGRIEATNPCGEQPLLPYESCNLGSLNLVRMLRDGDIDWQKLREVTKTAVRFLDNVIDVNCYPLPQIERISKANRKIGLGVMGFADLLYLLGIPYDSDDAVELAERLMLEISRVAREASEELAEERGPFPNFRGSIYDRPGAKKIRNATRTTIAPTGTLSLIAGVSSGIEPNFALCYQRTVNGQSVSVVNPVFERAAKSRKFHRPELMEEILTRGNLTGIEEIPEAVRRVFVTALEIGPEWHVRVQAAFQKHCDNAVSKTVNLRASATAEDVQRVFLLAYKLKCKGITIFRQGSRTAVLSTGLRDRQYVEVRERPRITSGQTEKFGTGCGSLYVVVNRDDNGLLEVFSSLGKGGGCAASSEATARLVSLCLRSDVNPKEVVRQLRGIRCATACSTRAAGKPVDVLSCPDAIARAISRFLGERDEGTHEGQALTICPRCGGQREPGRCGICLSCWEGGCEGA